MTEHHKVVIVGAGIGGAALATVLATCSCWSGRRDTTLEATAPEVKTLREENARLKQALAETVLENRPGASSASHGSKQLQPA